MNELHLHKLCFTLFYHVSPETPQVVTAAISSKTANYHSLITKPSHQFAEQLKRLIGTAVSMGTFSLQKLQLWIHGNTGKYSILYIYRALLCFFGVYWMFPAKTNSSSPVDSTQLSNVKGVVLGASTLTSFLSKTSSCNLRPAQMAWENIQRPFACTPCRTFICT